MDPRDGIVLCRELDDHRDKLQRTSVEGVVNIVDRRRASLSRSVAAGRG